MSRDPRPPRALVLRLAGRWPDDPYLLRLAVIDRPEPSPPGRLVAALRVRGERR